jgi:hypothetical protein
MTPSEKKWEINFFFLDALLNKKSINNKFIKSRERGRKSRKRESEKIQQQQSLAIRRHKLMETMKNLQQLLLLWRQNKSDFHIRWQSINHHEYVCGVWLMKDWSAFKGIFGDVFFIFFLLFIESTHKHSSWMIANKKRNDDDEVLIFFSFTKKNVCVRLKITFPC